MDQPLLGAEVVAAINAVDDFSGVVSVSEGGGVFTMHGGLADRAHALPITPTTRFGIASGSKGFTAVTVVGLIADGTLALDTRARELLGADLPLVDDRVTVEHLLAHRSGIGDYLDEDAHSSVTDHVMPVPVHRLATTEDFLAVLDGHPQVSAPGERFAYNNGGFVVLALLAERAAGVPFHDLVQRRVFDPAGMAGAPTCAATNCPATSPPATCSPTACGPTRSTSRCAAPATAAPRRRCADLDAFWRALCRGALVPDEWVAEMVRPRSSDPDGPMRYGLGLWLREDGRPQLEGYDAGVSFRSVHDPARRRSVTVVSNWSDGAWPICRLLGRYARDGVGTLGACRRSVT